ncbi:hypothetical protein Pcinc_041830 [Petrolisthes cinctipes]|uniref:Secreted protein n=1 Tax=Petrolisthes cinctipes TaxID=88211 RepID=A0AAE1EHF0_PETCI|nr:hypothetical protein Pcinc_041830 [Petrolisthes cinctipes]
MGARRVAPWLVLMGHSLYMTGGLLHHHSYTNSLSWTAFDMLANSVHWKSSHNRAGGGCEPPEWVLKPHSAGTAKHHVAAGAGATRTHRYLAQAPSCPSVPTL